MTGIAMFISEARKLIELAAQLAGALTENVLIPISLGAFTAMRVAVHAVKDAARTQLPGIDSRTATIVVAAIVSALATCVVIGAVGVVSSSY